MEGKQLSFEDYERELMRRLMKDCIAAIASAEISMAVAMASQ